MLLLTNYSCTKVSNNGIPSYVKFSDVSIETNNFQGSSMHSFSELWLSKEGNDFGAYQFPNTIPLLISGENEITINPGIMYNADVNTRKIHPLFEPFKATYNFIQKDTIEIKPVFKYRESVEFVYIEDFESSNNFDNFERTDVLNINNIEGKSGMMSLSSTEKVKKSLIISPLEIAQGKRIYLEFNIKTESYVGVGFESITSNGYTSLAIFSPNDEWITYYFELTSFINSTKEGEYIFYVEAQKAKEGEEEETYFDNLKIMAF